MIRGLHAMFYSSQDNELRAFLRDKLGQHPGASINDVTDESRLDLLSGVAALSGTPVTVSGS